MPSQAENALILLGFAGAFRRSELVKIQVADLAVGPHGLSVILPCSKADQLGEGSIVHPLTSSRPQPACPPLPRRGRGGNRPACSVAPARRANYLPRVHDSTGRSETAIMNTGVVANSCASSKTTCLPVQNSFYPHAIRGVSMVQSGANSRVQSGAQAYNRYTSTFSCNCERACGKPALERVAEKRIV